MRRTDDGSVLLLVIGFAGVLLAVVAVVVDVSAVVLAKRAVASAADGAAVTAAQSLDLDALYAGGLGAAVPLSQADAEQRVAAYREGLDLPGLELRVRVDGTTAVVDARRVVRLPFPFPGRRDVEVQAQARARAPVRS